jgi:acyl transferase domain-containing protein/NADPH:quinone reductase-like Zn-dependent oxidoreductase/NAD(P)-dependent dehydrogenase (short-subunit alcohol dehydrogenase family)
MQRTSSHPVPTSDPGLSPLKRAFLALESSQQRVAALERAAREPIAVIGVGCRVPGADNPDAFWRLMRDGVDAIGTVPPDRFDIDALFDPDPEAPGRIATRYGGFLRNVDQFDCGFFGIAPREAHGIDPQQRLLLEVSWEALENAGQAPTRLETSKTGVYFGLCTNDYSYLQVLSRDPALLNAHFGSGIAHSIASGRLSYLLGLQGPSLTIDTACSSSLVAVHLACQALRSGDCRMALAGGANLMLGPELFIALSHSRMLAPDGRCKTFSAAADGFARGEGCGVVVLKRLVDAKADGDRVLAVIRGTAVNQDGPSSALTAPNGPAQEEVIRAALAWAGLRPREIGYVEAHGTGTQLGDPLEIQALDGVFGSDRDPGAPLVIGSVKTNIGHLEAAAGVTGLIKLILALRNKQIPPHLHMTAPNPHIDWSSMRFKVTDSVIPWDPIDGRRIGGVSSFGFSGTNVHVIVEEALSEAQPQPRPISLRAEPTANVFAISARDVTALSVHAGQCAVAVAGYDERDLEGICHTANFGRSHFAERATVMGCTIRELSDRLGALARGEDALGIRKARLGRRDPPRIAFVFTGQGSQYSGMARRLHEVCPTFRDAFDRCATLLKPHLSRALHDVVFEDKQSDLGNTGYTQPALFAVEYALTEMWRSFGVTPSLVAGHSVGEIVAATVAGVFSLEDGLRVIALRGALIASLPEGGSMAVIAASEEDVAAVTAQQAGVVAIAAVNAATQTVISGAEADVKRVGAYFAGNGVRCQRLPVSHAFHSPLMDPVLDQFEREMRTITMMAPRLRLISNLTGRFAETREITQPQYWRRHVREVVRFGDSVETMLAQKPDCILEIGPHPTLLSLFGAGSPEGPKLIGSLRKGRDDWEQVLESASALFLAGAEIDWRGAARGERREIVDLPTYPFQRERCWFSAQTHGPAAKARGRFTGNAMLGTKLRIAGAETVYENRVSAEQPAFVAQHKIQGQVVMPATAYLEALLAAAHDLFGAGARAVEDVTLQEVMLLADDPSEARTVQLVLTLRDDGAGSARICSTVDSDADSAEWKFHVSAVLPSATPTRTRGVGYSLAEARQLCTEQIDAAMFYAGFVQRGLGFGPLFQSVKRLWKGSHQALGEVTLREPLPSDRRGYHMHPLLLDGCLQLVGAALMPATDDELYLPFAIGRYTLHRDGGQACWAHVVVDAGKGGETRRADLRVFDTDGELVAELDDVRLKRIAHDTLARIGRRSIDNNLYETVWEREPLQGLQPGRAGAQDFPVEAKRDWLILGDTTGVAAGLAERLLERGDRCQITYGGEPFDRAPHLPLDRPLHGVIDARALDLPDIDGVPSSDFCHATTEAVATAMRVAQALVGHTPAPRLWMLTRGAQAIAGSERRLAPAAAALWGLGKALRLEHPELRTVCIDLDPAFGSDEQDSLLAELDTPDREGEVVLRTNVRHVARLAHLPAARDAEKQSPWRLVPELQGSLDSMLRVPCDRPTPAAGEVEITVEAAALNFKDVLGVLGLYPGDPGPLGGECSGVVSAVGAGVERLRIGDPVIALGKGSFGSHVIAPAHFVQLRSPGISAEEGASFSIAYLTAEFCLGHLAKLHTRQRVLIHAAAGGVGMAAVYLARRAGAEIFATAGSPWKRQMLHAMGVTHVFDSRSADFAEKILAATDGRGVDVVLNSLGGDLIEPSFAVLARGGCFVEIGKRGIKSHSWVEALHRDLRYHIVDVGETATSDPELIAGMYARLAEQLRSGKLMALPRHVFAIDHAEQAFKFMAQARHAGKVVVRFAGTKRWALRTDATYLVTGGLSGLGLQVARWLVEAGAKRLLLVGRRGVTPEAAPLLKAWRSAGTDVVAEALDVADEGGLRALLERERAAGPPLRGVWHCAGVYDDGALMQQDYARYARVFAPKVHGAVLLDALTRSDPLDCFVMFSSVASVLGSPGQSNYSAANAFMDALAHQRASRGLPALSINWGPWSEVGAAADRGITERLAARGVATVTPEQGLFAMQELLSQDRVQVAVLPIDWARYLAQLAPAGTPSFFARLVVGAPSSRASAPPTLASTVPNLRRQLDEAPVARRRPLVAGFVHQRASHALGIDSRKPIDPRTPLGDLGLDSLLAVELRNTLSRAIGEPLPVTLLFDYPTLDALTGCLLELLEPESSRGVFPAGGADSKMNLVSSIEELSDAEVDRMIDMRAQRKS